MFVRQSRDVMEVNDVLIGERCRSRSLSISFAGVCFAASVRGAIYEHAFADLSVTAPQTIRANGRLAPCSRPMRVGN